MKSFKQFINEALDIKNKPNFWRWFGKSKVVDEHGDPLILYHGTTHDFDKFDPSRSGSRKLVAFFSTHKFANHYVTGYSNGISIHKGGNLIPVFLKMENPFDFRDRECIDTAAAWFKKNKYIIAEDDLDEIIADYHGMNVNRIRPDVRREFTSYEFSDLISRGSWVGIESGEFISDMIVGGYDGVIMKEHDHLTYGICHSTQIKSATGNNGNFDPNDPDITH